MIRIVTAFLVLASVPLAPIRANVVQELSMQQRLARSHLVIVGLATELSEPTSADSFDGYARVRVLYILKGVASDSLRVSTSESIAELETDCCEVGKRYLLFLEQISKDKYVPVNGQFGVYRLET